MHPTRAPALSLLLLLLAGCAASPADTAAAPKRQNATPAQCDLNDPAALPGSTPSRTSTDAGTDAAASLAALGVSKVTLNNGHEGHDVGPHNLWWLRQPGAVDGEGGLISGALPENDADFARLKALGVSTIISVDGASPDVAAAARQGMTYIHIPTQYSAVEPDEQIAVARAIAANLSKGNVYIHCHHGKHRSPAQAAAAAVGLGWMSADQAVAFMKKAGTADNYVGLYSCVAESRALDRATITAPVRPGEFVPVHKPAGIVSAMLEVDSAYDHLGQIRLAGWKTPTDHPDLVPADEAGRLTDHLRFSGEDPSARTLGAGFEKQLAAAIASATALEDGLLRKDDASKLDRLWAPVVASCKDCHKQFRDKR